MLIRCFLVFRLRRFPLERHSIITLDLRSVRLGFAEAALLEGGGETKRRLGWNLTLDRQKPETGKAEVGMEWRSRTAPAHSALRLPAPLLLSIALSAAAGNFWLHCSGDELISRYPFEAPGTNDLMIVVLVSGSNIHNTHSSGTHSIIPITGPVAHTVP